ncbi:MAG TPA: FdhF/YdeP family oxidoreductase [Fimbriimonadaceae bacterium]|nr:FdhF/YdeP family oxidoreductase [Fimbriimonadaceae bacterium]
MPKQVRHGGGWRAILYTVRKAREAGPVRLWKAMRSKNACKTCALGMGGQLGGMRNEAGHFPEFCKKSLQAMVADMQGRIEPRFFSTYSVGQLKQFSSREMEHAGRLVEPLMLTPEGDHYQPISWHEAIEHIANSLLASQPERTVFYASGRSSNEAGFLLQLFARAYGTNHVNNCSYYCHQASGVGLSEALGSGTATVMLDDLDSCDLVFLIGANPASNHPRLMASLMRVRNRGGRVIVVNPLKETGLSNFRVPSNPRSLLFGSEIASTYVQPKIGGDIAFMMGIAKALLEQPSQVDLAFINAQTDNFEALKELVQESTWSEICEATGVSESQIREVATIYACSDRTIFAWTMGITHHLHGTENVQWIVNLALLRGMVGKAGAGLMPIRGHSNVQGLGTIGVTPRLPKTAIENLRLNGINVPDWTGYDTMSALQAASQGEVDFALCLGGNLFGASPDPTFVADALGKVKTVVYMSTTLNTGHASGLGQTTIILPVLARDEESCSSTQESMFSYVRLSDGGKPRHQGPRSESPIIADIAHQVLGSSGPVPWEKMGDHETIRQWIAKVVPNLEQVAEIGSTKREFHIPGRAMREPRFKTANGRAMFSCHRIPKFPPLSPNELRLMTIRSEGQFNTVVYEEEDVYRNQERRDIILMSKVDMERLGLRPDEPVRVYNSTGELRGILVRPYEIAEGCAAMYAPEANVLVPRDVDPKSKTPAYKSVVVKVESDDPSFIRLAPSPLARRSETRKNMKAC